jgi:hypothetical protein
MSMPGDDTPWPAKSVRRDGVEQDEKLDMLSGASQHARHFKCDDSSQRMATETVRPPGVLSPDGVEASSRDLFDR